MRAWQVESLGEPVDVLRLADDAPTPVPAESEVLVRVLAAAVNFPDALMCRGEYQVKPELPFAPGVEVCGEVLEVGPNVTGIEVGSRVIGPTVPPHGGFAENAVLRGPVVLAAPASLDDAEASALLIGYQTGWFGLHVRAGLQQGETLLVHAAAGGVGSAAVQLGKAAGARVIAVAGGEAKTEVARRLGADVVVDRHREDFVEVVKRETDGRGADVIYDPVGGETYRRSTKCVAFEGRILLVGFAGGEIQDVRLNHALIKNYSIVGLHWGLYQEKDPALIYECHAALTELAARGDIKPFISEQLSFDDLPKGLQRLADGLTVGRLALVP